MGTARARRKAARCSRGPQAPRKVLCRRSSISGARKRTGDAADAAAATTSRNRGVTWRARTALRQKTDPPHSFGTLSLQRLVKKIRMTGKQRPCAAASGGVSDSHAGMPQKKGEKPAPKMKEPGLTRGVAGHSTTGLSLTSSGSTVKKEPDAEAHQCLPASAIQWRHLHCPDCRDQAVDEGKPQTQEYLWSRPGHMCRISEPVNTCGASGLASRPRDYDLILEDAG